MEKNSSIDLTSQHKDAGRWRLVRRMFELFFVRAAQIGHGPLRNQIRRWDKILEIQIYLILIESARGAATTADSFCGWRQRRPPPPPRSLKEAPKSRALLRCARGETPAASSSSTAAAASINTFALIARRSHGVRQQIAANWLSVRHLNKILQLPRHSSWVPRRTWNGCTIHFCL
jgi:hypothetical protein